MDNDWLFGFDDYRQALAHKLNSEGSLRGYRTRLARIAGCQLAYISHVLDGRAHFTPDQAAGLCEFWGFGDLESDYFMTLVHLARAGTARLKTRLEKHLEEIRSEHRESRRSRLSHAGYDSEKVVDYFLDWAVSAVHACLMIPSCSHPDSVQKRLGLDESRIRNALNVLQDLRFAKREGGEWKVTTNSFHAADENRFALLHHKNWRSHLTEILNRRTPSTESLHYTAIHSLSRADFEKIREILIESISRSRDVVRPSPEETVACLALDWFEL